jgi:hypothetical protein
MHALLLAEQLFHKRNTLNAPACSPALRPDCTSAATKTPAAATARAIDGIYMRCIDELLMATSERVNGRRGDFRPRFGTMLASGEAESGSAGTQPGEE